MPRRRSSSSSSRTTAAPGRVERARRLVEEQELRLADHRLRDPEPLLHPLRHRGDSRAARVGKADELEQLAALARRRPANAARRW